MSEPQVQEPERAVSEWRQTAEWDWVWLGEGGVLHAVALVVNDPDEVWFGEGYTECGRGGRMHIPGLLSRMAAPRCKRCCSRTGMPQGAQSPKNIDECRPVVEARLRSLGSNAA